MARIQAQRDMERRHRVMAVHGARAFWSRAKPLVGQHPYLSAKGLSAVGCAGLRTHEDLLVVPVTSGDVMTSVQTITPEGVKRFWAGAPVKAGSFILDRHNAAITILCEGLATGLACFQSVKNSRVIVCFDAGNLLPVTQLLKPQGSVVFMADNDYKTKALRGTNPGIEKATNAAELIGAGVAWVDEIEGTDAADYLYEMGQGAGKKLERLILAKAKYVMT
jgi:putative DNA primase/helicase